MCADIPISPLFLFMQYLLRINNFLHLQYTELFILVYLSAKMSGNTIVESKNSKESGNLNAHSGFYF